MACPLAGGDNCLHVEEVVEMDDRRTLVRDAFRLLLFLRV